MLPALPACCRCCLLHGLPPTPPPACPPDAAPPRAALPCPCHACRYGEFVVLDKHDHISVCKPTDTSDPAYARLMAFLHARAREVRLERADRAAASVDHMQAAAI